MPSTGPASLKAHAVPKGLYTGAAVNLGLLAHDPVYKQTLIDQYNIVVAENAMKWAALRPAPDQFDFSGADTLVSFAETHKMAIRGHNLCWHEALPNWFDATVTGANAQQYLTSHIATVAGRYKGKIRAWDVVNEAIAPRDGQPDGLRNGPWYKLLGPGFLDIAFHAARAADPHALLTYNDYGIETDSPEDTAKRDAVLALLKRMKKDGVPLDAVGIQSHLSAASASKIGAGLEAFVAACADLGLKVFITELDINDDGLTVDDPKARALLVAAIYTFMSPCCSRTARLPMCSPGVSATSRPGSTRDTRARKSSARSIPIGKKSACPSTTITSLTRRSSGYEMPLIRGTNLVVFGHKSFDGDLTIRCRPNSSMAV
jgi:endo-1,4-beta-xylanase